MSDILRQDIQELQQEVAELKSANEEDLIKTNSEGTIINGYGGIKVCKIKATKAGKIIIAAFGSIYRNASGIRQLAILKNRNRHNIRVIYICIKYRRH